MTQRDSLKNLQAKYDQQVKEAASIKEKHVKWEDKLNENLRKYREEKKEWSYEMEGVREKLEETKVSGYCQGSRAIINVKLGLYLYGFRRLSWWHMQSWRKRGTGMIVLSVALVGYSVLALDVRVRAPRLKMKLMYI